MTEVMFAHALRNYDHFDILTYTISPMHIFAMREIKRLIYCVGKPPRKVSKSIRVSGTHAKIWICYKRKDDKTPDVFIGSANATEMTLHEIMIRLTGDKALVLTKHFNYLWENNQ